MLIGCRSQIVNGLEEDFSGSSEQSKCASKGIPNESQSKIEPRGPVWYLNVHGRDTIAFPPKLIGTLLAQMRISFALCRRIEA
jgi:hypothetical protein